MIKGIGAAIKAAGINARDLKGMTKVAAERYGKSDYVKLFEFMTKDGAYGTYRVNKMDGALEQIVSVFGKKGDTVPLKQVRANLETNSKRGLELLSRDVTIPECTQSIYIREKGKTLFAGKTVTTPISEKTKIVDGKVRATVNNVQEHHASVYFPQGKGGDAAIARIDKRIGADGAEYPIYQNVNEYRFANNTKMPLNGGWFDKSGRLVKLSGQETPAQLENVFGSTPVSNYLKLQDWFSRLK